MSLKNHETEHPSLENGWLTWNHFAEKIHLEAGVDSHTGAVNNLPASNRNSRM